MHFVLPSSWSAVSTPNSPPKGASVSQLQMLTQHTNLQGPPGGGPRLPGTAPRELLTQCITGPLEWTLTHTPSSLQVLELRSIEAFKEGQTVGKKKRPRLTWSLYLYHLTSLRGKLKTGTRPQYSRAGRDHDDGLQQPPNRKTDAQRGAMTCKSHTASQ